MKSLRIFFRAIRQFDADGASQMGAALAYYALFSTAPLLILAVMVAGMFFGEEAARTRVQEHLRTLIDEPGATEVTRLMEHATRPAEGRLAATIGIAALFIGALSAFLHVRRCLCAIWRIEPPKSGLLLTLLNYALAAIMVFVMGVLLLASLAVSTAIPIVADMLKDELPDGPAFWQWVDAGTSLLLLTLFFALVFRVMSARRISWWSVLYGAIVTSLLFTIGKMLISLYLAYTSTVSAYGAAGSLVVFLVWVYYSSQILFFGAELVQARRTYDDWRNPKPTSAEATP